MNKIILTGRLTKDGEVRTTESNIQIYNNTIAVQRNYKNKDGNYDTDFLSFSYFSPNDNLIPYLKKGKQILVDGRIQTKIYDTQDGNKKYVTEIIVNNLELLGGGKKEDNNTQQELDLPTNYNTTYDDKEIKLEDSDLPF